VWHWQRSLLRAAECLGTVGYWDGSAAREGRIASSDRCDCVAGHTCDDLWVILSSYHQKRVSKAAEKRAFEKDTDEAYKSTLGKMPDAKQKVDPWGSMRTPQK
jgi:hypothetical protein